ncbi:MAG: ribbon-helix-helix protein, CopG family [Chloroflexi bacterium]|nr:ribbon-helix-helix protein, CopG family [Chloroflexota bacterium]
MKRTQVQLDDATFEMLRRKAFDRGISMAGLVRDALHEYLGLRVTKLRRIQQFQFIGSGRSEQGDLAPVSECHDEALAEDSSQ